MKTGRRSAICLQLGEQQKSLVRSKPTRLTHLRQPVSIAAAARSCLRSLTSTAQDECRRTLPRSTKITEDLFAPIQKYGKV